MTRVLLVRCLLALTVVCSLPAQLIPTGTPIPRRDKPPVVFLNGYDTNCADSGFAGVFGLADQVLQADGRVSLYFNNCDYPGKPAIEVLGREFGTYLGSLRYEDGQPVTTLDVVAYSMGGLVVRSYLSGKQPGTAVFNPPASTPIRKLIFVATPHFGVSLPITPDRQAEQMTVGSQFLFDLATWNQGTDDLRGVDALASGRERRHGQRGRTAGFRRWSGYAHERIGRLRQRAERTRAIPFCHTPGGGLISLFGLCPSDARSVAAVRTATEPQGRILLSFLSGTSDWMSVGTGVADNPHLSANGGLYLMARAADDSPVSLTSAAAQVAGGASRPIEVKNPAIAYGDRLPGGAATITLNGTVNQTRNIIIQPGVYEALVLKPGPRIARVYPSATAVFPLSVAPGMFVSIYGEALAANAAQTPTVDLPLQLSDAQVLVNSAPVPLHYAGPTQINAVMSESASGLVTVTVTNGSGRHTVNVLVDTAVPAIFTQNGSGSGAASALSATNNLLVTETNPLRAGDYLQLYLTGLGATTPRDGLDWANLQPTVTVGGQPCAVSYAGRAPGYRGLDQINCQIPPGLGRNPAAAVVVTSGSRRSNTATVAVD
jgi:uncharacterized protein (TIGR03437 family)